MCGILGGYQVEINPERIHRALDSIIHRGPDGKSVHLDGPHFLANVRLAIVGSAEVTQPFISPNGEIKAIANGEIYNWRELRSELESAGHQFFTQCDMEILPAAWLQWGEAMFAKFRGMFSIALLDKDELILARDPCGQKPLYYTQVGRSFYFSSEIKALRVLGIQPNLDPTYLSQYLTLRYIPEPNTLYQDIKILPSGSLCKIQKENITIQRWWQPPPLSSPSIAKSEAQQLEQLEQLLDESVKLACPSDQKSMLYLSSGIDSSLLLDSAVKQGKDIQTVTASFSEGIDENLHASKLANSYGITHQEVKLDQSIFSNLERVVGQMEVPVGDSIILAFDALAKHTKSLNCRVALGGEGPDELFQGYSFQKLCYYAEHSPALLPQLLGKGLHYFPSSILERFSNFPAKLGSAGKRKVSQWLSNYPHLSRWEKGAGLRTLFTPQEATNLLIQSDFQTPSLPNNLSVLEAHHMQQFNEWLPDWSIIRQERNTMAHSIEYRMPFLDPELMAFSGEIPMDSKIRKGKTKWLWRELAKKRLGERNGSIPKVPFYMPVQQFSQTKVFKELVGDLLSPERIQQRGIFSVKEVQQTVDSLCPHEFLSVKKVMSLLIFELWHDQI